MVVRHPETGLDTLAMSVKFIHKAPITNRNRKYSLLSYFF